MFRAFIDTVKKIYFSPNIVLWLVILFLPVGTSIFMVEFFSARIILHVPIGIVRQDASLLADKLENAGFLVAPVLLPFIIRQALSLEVGLGERDRCP